ncbi:MAG TPA: peptidoglycan-associated lipoprotein Pal [Oligoflexia bacterium]|nr:peptidoglycan-associated lipoprotein Pal [Oligoflexia bacterium]HMP27820.1 peptidoglycan-associated lipoprotein Pal [Oligoflexia bacterium]
MKSLKFLMIFALLTFVGTGCACRAKKVGGPDNIPVAEAGDVLRDVNFAFDSSQLDATARKILADNASWLNANPSKNVQVEGHCDERGTNEYNMALGARRAKAAADYLVSLGVAASRISTVSYGEEMPLDPRHNEEAWARNRRAHFRILN